MALMQLSQVIYSFYTISCPLCKNLYNNVIASPDQDEINAKEADAKDEAERNSKPQETEEDADDPPAEDATPAPQIKLGPNGEIILDEQSLVSLLHVL